MRVSSISKTRQECQKESLFLSEERLIGLIDAIMADSEIPGLVAIAINKNGEKRVYTSGNAIWGVNSPIRSDNIFRISSMTKLLTSIAALQIVENDAIELDEDLSSIMPEMASIPILTDEEMIIESRNPITLRHLLTHTSGFGYSCTDYLLDKFETKSWKYADLPRRFESGTQFLYGSSLDWAGRLVERISGLNLEDYFRTHITGPLEMNRTWFNIPESIKNEIVSYGSRSQEGSKGFSEYPDRIPECKTKNYNGGGGLFSSPEDFTNLLACLLNDGSYGGVQLLKKSTVDEMFKYQTNDISMNIENNYFQTGYCCDFRGIIKPNSKWGLAGLIDTESTHYGREAGILLWGGM